MLGLFDFLRRGTRKRTPRRRTGDAAEHAAERFLRKRGFRILARNVSYTQGEVDLVAAEKRTGALCFVEVRSRAEAGGDPAVAPEETVTPAKRRRIIRAARRFLGDHRAPGIPRWAEAYTGTIRFDVIAVRFQGADRKQPDIRHYPGAFDFRGRLL